MFPPARQVSYHGPDPARVAQGELSEQAGVAAAHALLARRLRQETADVERTRRRPPAGAVVPVGIIALFGFNFAFG
jgi:hypothetical protein